MTRLSHSNGVRGHLPHCKGGEAMLSGNDSIAIAQATIHPDEDGVLTLEYYVCIFTGLEGEVLYGLRVDKRHQEGGLIEREETPPITGSLAEIKAMAERFAAGTVPPCVLLEIIDEWYETSFAST